MAQLNLGNWGDSKKWDSSAKTPSTSEKPSATKPPSGSSNNSAGLNLGNWDAPHYWTPEKSTTPNYSASYQKYDTTQDAVYSYLTGQNTARDYDTTRKYLDEANGNLASINEQLASVASTDTQNRRALEGYKSWYENAAKALERQSFADNNARKAQIDEQIKAKQAEVDKLAGEFTQLNSDAAEALQPRYDPRLNDTNARLTQAQRELQALQETRRSYGENTNAERDEKIAEYQKLVHDMNHTANTYSTAYMDMQRRAEELRAELDRMEQEEYFNPLQYYTGTDRAIGVMDASLQQSNAGLVNLAGMGLRTLDKLSMGMYTPADNTNTKLQEYLPDIYGVSPDADNFEQSQSALVNAATSVEAKADEMGADAQATLARAKEGLGQYGQMGIDIATNVIQMGYDAVLAVPTGGKSLIPMFARTFGNSAQEARQAGATFEQQAAYGLTKATIEAATEKLADGVAGIYGKGAADDIIESVIGKLSSNKTGRSVLRFIANAASEGGEEVISDLLSPFAERIYNDQALRDLTENGYDASELLYDFLIGAAIGGLGQVGDVARGGYAAKNAELSQADLLRLSIEDPTAYRAALEEAFPVSAPETAQNVLEASGGIPAPAEEANASTGNSDEFNSANRGPSLIERVRERLSKAFTPLDRKAAIDSMDFGEQVAAIENGEISKSEKPFANVSDTTPQVLIEKAGAKQLPVIMDFDSVYLASRKNGDKAGHYHNLGADLMSEIPANLNNPLAIIRQANGRIAEILPLSDSKGDRIYVAIELEASKDVNSKNDVYNLVVSSFGAGQNYINNQLNNPNNTVIENNLPGEPAQVNPRLIELSGTVNAVTPGINNNVLQNGQNVKWAKSQTRLDRYGQEEAPAKQAQRSARTFARELRKEQGGVDNTEIDTKLLAERIQDLADYIQGNNNGQGLDDAQLRGMAERIADYVISSTYGEDLGDTSRQYAELRSYLKQAGLRIDPSVADDFSKEELQKFRNDYGFKLNLRKGGLPVDVAYMELLESMPGVLDPSLINPGDQIREIARKLDSLRNGRPAWVETVSKEEYGAALDELTDRIIDEAYNIRSKAKAPEAEPGYLEALDEEAPPQTVSFRERIVQNRAAEVGAEAAANEKAGPPQRKISQFWSNTLKTIEDAEADPNSVKNPLYYIPKSNVQSLAEAASMLAADTQGTIEKLIDAEAWSAPQNAAAYTVRDSFRKEALESGDWSAYSTWREIMRAHETATAQGLQYNAQFTAHTGETAIDNAVSTLADSDIPQANQNDIINEVADYANRFDKIKEGDTKALKSLIKEIAERRGTWTIVKKNMDKFLNKQSEEWMREAAYRQLEALPRDAMNRGKQNMANKVASFRVLAMLSGLPTIGRNITGNTSFGLLDMFSSKTAGRAIDAIVNKALGTDKRTVVGSRGKVTETVPAWWRNATEAMQTNMLETALDISLDEGSRPYDMPANSAFVADGGTIEKMFQRWSQIMSYALTSSDRFYRGGIESGEAANLEAFEGSNLTAEEAEQLAQNTANYRLFQNSTAISQWAKKNRTMLNNMLGWGGEVSPDGTRTRDNTFGIGTLAMPFIEVPTNLALKTLEYSPANLAKGMYEIAKLAQAVKTGDATAIQQQSAVMDTARGLTGTGVLIIATALAKAGLIRNGDDEEDYDVAAVNSASGMSGTQWNLSATLRGLSGQGTDWQDGDEVISLAGISPIDMFLNAGTKFAALAPDSSLGDYNSAFLQAAISSTLDMPLFSSLADLSQTLKDAEQMDMETAGDLAGDALDSMFSGFVPQFVRQFAKAADPYYRDVSSDSWIGERINNAMQYLPGLRNMLDPKLTGYGEPKEQGPAALRWLVSLALPMPISELNISDVTDTLSNIREATGKDSFYPDRRAPSNITIDGEKLDLNTGEKRAYLETYGTAYTAAIQSAMESDWWDMASDEVKANFLQNVESFAKDTAKRGFAENREIEYTSDWDDEFTMDDPIAPLMIKAITSEAKKNNDFAKLDEVVSMYNSLPEETKTKLDSGDTSRLDSMAAVAKVGVDAETWDTVYKKYTEINGKPIKKQEMAMEFTTWLDRQSGLNRRQRDAITNELKYYNMNPADTEKYDALMAGGLSSSKAESVYDTMNALQPLPGNKGVNQNQKIEAIIGLDLSDAEKWAAWEEYVTHSDGKGSAYQKGLRAKATGQTYNEWATKFTGYTGPTSGTADTTTSGAYDIDALLRAYGF